jgi:hypothetical protein
VARHKNHRESQPYCSRPVRQCGEEHLRAGGAPISAKKCCSVSQKGLKPACSAATP